MTKGPPESPWKKLKKNHVSFLWLKSSSMMIIETNQFETILLRSSIWNYLFETTFIWKVLTFENFSFRSRSFETTFTGDLLICGYARFTPRFSAALLIFVNYVFTTYQQLFAWDLNLLKVTLLQMCSKMWHSKGDSFRKSRSPHGIFTKCNRVRK